jgi:hypothetical protein
MSNLRDRLIKQAAFSKRSKNIPLQIVSDDGSPIEVVVEIRTPNVAQANMIAASEREGPDKASEAVAQIVIQCCFDPETGKPVFQSTDVPFILEQSPSSWVGVLVKEITELTAAAQANAKN